MFICMQKIKFIADLFLKILQRYCKLVLLDTLGTPAYAHPKCYDELVENLSACKKINFITHVFLEILQRLANLFRVILA